MPNGQRSAPDRHADDDTRLPAPRVLVADDDRVNQLLTVRLLEQLGCDADVAVNGLTAVEAVARHRYAAVLMDCCMPDLDGFDATRRIRAQEGQHSGEGPRHVPIIAMTANGSRDRCLAAGMDDFIAKPLQVETLRAALDRCLDPQLRGRLQGRPK